MRLRPGRDERRARLATMASALALALGTAACGTTYEDHVIVPAQAYDGTPLVTPLPVTVGLYYGPEMRGHEENVARSRSGRVDRYHLRLGPASIALFDRILAAQFDAVRPVDRLPTAEDVAPHLDAVIAVSIGHAGLMSVHYDLTLYAPAGSVIAEFDANGSSYADDMSEETIERGLRVAMRTAAAKFLVDFPDRPEVAAWLRRVGAGQPLAMGPPQRRGVAAE